MATADHNIAVYDDRLGNAIEKSPDVPQIPSESQNGDGDEKLMKVTVDPDEGVVAEGKSSYGKRMARKLRPNRIIIHLIAWLLVTT